MPLSIPSFTWTGWNSSENGFLGRDKRVKLTIIDQSQNLGLTARTFSRRLVTWKRATPEEGAEPRAERISKGWWHTTHLDAFQRWSQPNSREKGISTGAIREPYPKPKEASAARSELSTLTIHPRSTVKFRAWKKVLTLERYC